MKKGLKIIGIILAVIVVIGIVFFAVDYNRVNKKEKPIFCINIATYRDGGSKEYLGLGYKIIDFHRVGGYMQTKIGTWFMDYKDFSDEYEKEPGLISVENNTTSSYIPDGINVADENNIGIPANSQKFDRSPENVTIKIDKETISPTSVTIIITDNNKDSYGWGVEFRVQKSVDGEWKDLKYISDDLSWIEIAYELNKDNQLNQKLNIEKYYGKLSNGLYRIVKSIYDNGYVDIYSDEFEIK